MEEGVQRLAALVLLAICLSHVTAPAAWARLFEGIASRGETAGLATAAIHLPLGLIIVAFHDVWRWPDVVATVIGWALLLKGTLHLLFPSIAHRSLALAGEGETGERRYRLAGLLMLPLALGVGWIALA